MNTLRNIGLAFLVSTFVAGAAGTAMAGTWQQDHPRRAEVNHRLARQDARINHDRATGKITASEAARLHRDDRTVRGQERFDASFDRGHITKADKRAFNQDENAISRQIHRDAH